MNDGKEVNYKVYGYACFYKADSAFVNAIKIDEITVTLVSFHKPREMLKCLKEEGRYQIKEIEKGHYYIEGGIFPVQLVVTSLISEKENFWLRNLTNRLDSIEKVQEQYQKHGENKLYKSVMDIIVKANKELFNRREQEMCQALFDIYKDDLMEMAKKEVIKLHGEELRKEAEEKVKKELGKEIKEELEKEIKKELEEEIKEERIGTVRKMLVRGYSKEEIQELDYTQKEMQKAEKLLLQMV